MTVIVWNYGTAYQHQSSHTTVWNWSSYVPSDVILTVVAAGGYAAGAVAADGYAAGAIATDDS